MKQRKGFTLIELMIVIAIIIILAAIAIPNYLRMTDRARRARVAGDFASLATAVEAYSVDWGKYVTVTTAEKFGKPIDGTASGMVSVTAIELTGTKGLVFPNVDTVNFQNAKGKTTLTGEDGGIEYFKAGTIQAMYNPFVPTGTDTGSGYYYVSDATGTHWALYCYLKALAAGPFLYRTDTTTDLKEVTTAPITTALNP